MFQKHKHNDANKKTQCNFLQQTGCQVIAGAPPLIFQLFQTVHHYKFILGGGGGGPALQEWSVLIKNTLLTLAK